MVNKWMNIIQTLRPKGRCYLCNALAEQAGRLCNRCHARLQYINNPCMQCGEPMPSTGLSSTRCGRCLATPPAYDLCEAPLQYTGIAKKLHHEFKFHQQLAAGKILAGILCDYLAERRHQLPQALVPIPLHARRMRQRGFDQSLELSRQLGRQLGIEILDNQLCRTIETAPQSGLNRKERRKNLSHAFAANNARPGLKHIALIDDVMTTGCTFNAASLVMRQSGIATIEVWAVCRSVMQ